MSTGEVNLDSDGHNMRRIGKGKNRLDIDEDGYLWAGTDMGKRSLEGTQFFGSHLFQSIADGSSVTALIVTSSTKNSHIQFGINASSACSWQIYEDSTIGGSTHGTSIATFNMHRSVTTSQATDTETSIWHTPTVLTDGTLIETGILGGTGLHSGAGGSATGSGFWVLDSSSSYTVKINNTKNGSICDVLISFTWHDH